MGLSLVSELVSAIVEWVAHKKFEIGKLHLIELKILLIDLFFSSFIPSILIQYQTYQTNA